MATIEKRGKSYRITVAAGIDLSGKQIRHRMVWTPDEKLTDRQSRRTCPPWLAIRRDI